MKEIRNQAWCPKCQCVTEQITRKVFAYIFTSCTRCTIVLEKHKAEEASLSVRKS